MVHFTNYK